MIEVDQRGAVTAFTLDHAARVRAIDRTPPDYPAEAGGGRDRVSR